MKGRIKLEQFRKYAKSIMKSGAKVCPCCLNDHLDFTTDDNHQEYFFGCEKCGIHIDSFLFMRIEDRWNKRYSDDPKLHKITHNITCEYWNDETCDIEKITLTEEDLKEDEEEEEE